MDRICKTRYKLEIDMISGKTYTVDLNDDEYDNFIKIVLDKKSSLGWYKFVLNHNRSEENLIIKINDISAYIVTTYEVWVNK